MPEIQERIAPFPGPVMGRMRVLGHDRECKSFHTGFLTSAPESDRPLNYSRDVALVISLPHLYLGHHVFHPRHHSTGG